jgi:hypothetical protein
MLAAGLFAAAATLAKAQGSVADGPATFELLAGHFDTTPAANFTGVAPTLAQDHVFEEGWWYRVQGDAAEKFFPPPTTQTYAGAVATLTWANVDGRGFSAEKRVTVTNAGGPSGSVRLDLTLTNNNAADLPIDVFHALDLDLAGTAGGDAAVLLAPNGHIRVTDGVQQGEYRGLGASAFLVRPFGDPADVPGELSDAGVDDFDNSGLPFAAGDITMGFQWATTAIPPGGQRTCSVVMAVNTAAVPVELMGWTVE